MVPFDAAGTRDPRCSAHFRTRNPRTRVINKEAYLHEMSNYPVCSPHGPNLGTMHTGSHFIVYYADPSEHFWCYGYSVQLARDGYVLCSDYDVP